VIEKLVPLDKELFLFLNGMHHPFFDFVFWWASNSLIWIPVYLLLLYLVIKKYRWQSLLVLLFAGLCITITDLTAFYGFKEVFLRLRPTHNPELQFMVHTLNGYKGGNYGFISNHAANYFGLAFFLIQLLYKRHPYLALGMILWASLIAYSRIYLGVHYPSDVAVGALLGMLVGWLLGTLYNYLSSHYFSKHRFLSVEDDD
jgi:undecaprenyl-diphosphatase